MISDTSGGQVGERSGVTIHILGRLPEFMVVHDVPYFANRLL